MTSFALHKKSCDNLHKNDCFEILRSDVDDTYSDLGGSGTGVHGVSTEIYRRWGHQWLTSSSVRQLLIGGICKENPSTHQRPVFFFVNKLLLIQKGVQHSHRRNLWIKTIDNSKTFYCSKVLFIEKHTNTLLIYSPYITKMKFNMVKVIHT